MAQEANSHYGAAVLMISCPSHLAPQDLRGGDKSNEGVSIHI